LVIEVARLHTREEGHDRTEVRTAETKEFLQEKRLIDTLQKAKDRRAPAQRDIKNHTLSTRNGTREKS